MTERWVISDLHFGHKNIIQYCKRPFSSVEEMDETLISNWNKVVKLQDVVYVLGDICINKKSLPLINQCNGFKRLILGNHDTLRIEEYQKYFTRIYAMRIFNDMIFTHIPIHLQETERFKFCVHGHIHDHVVYDSKGINPDKHYLNVSVERIDYTPINMERILQIRKECNV